ncbi:MAG: RNA-guided pseudouridylation complex pseudouridine synthase subunit Cbf5 [Methanocalculaceae archaeon]|jgi:tRNA pseudouridine55 synthase/H/ACA ribonucleoprotein complex subunit 4|nr:RNA-guided pseudouridylation complex pseudouridine synthase subunit Cbf5 [Methanocalculaceae archaeon]
MSYTGVLLIDKPQGPNSHQVAAWVGDMFKSSVGHSGTLDPMVSGVLVVMLGKAMQLASLLLLHEKEYVACLRLHTDIPRERVEDAMKQFTGRIYQRPPRRSAVKRTLRIRMIHQIELLDMQDRLILIRVRCETGTYIRSLCVHIGRVLGCGSQMIELRRTRSGRFSVEETHTLHEIRDAIEQGNEEVIQSMLLSPEEAIMDIPKIVVRHGAADAVAQGAILAGVGILQCDSFLRGQIVAIITEEEKLVALAEAIRDSAKFVCGEPGFVARSIRVFVSPSNANK